MHFGVLRVLNDDRVAAGQGFGTHPHDNMEIISIPLEGDLEHRDSMGNVALIKKESNGVYAFVLQGEVEIEKQYLESRDGFGLWDTKEIQVKALSKSRVLLMEIPMSI